MNPAAEKNYIPAGYVRDRLETIPDETEPLIRERDRLQTSNPSHPNIPQLNNQLADHIATCDREKWRAAVESRNLTQDTGLLWKLINSRTEKKLVPPNHVLSFKQNEITD